MNQENPDIARSPEAPWFEGRLLFIDWYRHLGTWSFAAVVAVSGLVSLYGGDGLPRVPLTVFVVASFLCIVLSAITWWWMAYYFTRVQMNLKPMPFSIYWVCGPGSVLCFLVGAASLSVFVLKLIWSL